MGRKQDFSAYHTLKVYHVPGTMLFYTLLYSILFNSHVVYFHLTGITQYVLTLPLFFILLCNTDVFKLSLLG